MLLERGWTSHTHPMTEHLAVHHGQVGYGQQGTVTSTEEEKIHCSYLTDKFEVSLHQKEFKFIVSDFGFPPAEQD